MTLQARADRQPLKRQHSTPALAFSDSEVERYSRHILLPELGATGQARLKESRVFVVGAGGLGSPLLLYLAAAGVGHIAFCDGDRVDLSNLQRQVLHATGDVGTPKVVSAHASLHGINPDISLRPIEQRVSAQTIADMIDGSYDLVLDGSDNFPTRYLVNDYCWQQRIPLISASVFRFEGQLAAFTQEDDSPCYRCIFPQMPEAGAVPSCAEAGVLGAVVGVMGCMQATEAIKLLTGIGTTLKGKLLRYDALRADSMVFSLPRDPGCPLCGESPAITELREEQQPACDVAQQP